MQRDIDLFRLSISSNTPVAAPRDSTRRRSRRSRSRPSSISLRAHSSAVVTSGLAHVRR